MSAGAEVRSSRVRMIAEKVKSVNNFRFSGQTGKFRVLEQGQYRPANCQDAGEIHGVEVYPSPVET
jgi:hypothetical protein